MTMKKPLKEEADDRMYYLYYFFFLSTYYPIHTTFVCYEQRFDNQGFLATKGPARSSQKATPNLEISKSKASEQCSVSDRYYAVC